MSVPKSLRKEGELQVLTKSKRSLQIAKQNTIKTYGGLKMNYLDEKQMLERAMRENEKLKAENIKLKANLEYVAIMTDTYIEEEEEEDVPNE